MDSSGEQRVGVRGVVKTRSSPLLLEFRDTLKKAVNHVGTVSRKMRLHQNGNAAADYGNGSDGGAQSQSQYRIGFVVDRVRKRRFSLRRGQRIGHSANPSLDC